MADDTSTTSTEDADKGTEGDNAAAIAAKGKDPAAVEAALRSERAAAREARKKADAAEAKVKEYEDRDKSVQEKAEAKAAEAEKRAQTAEQKALRLEVGGEKNLPTDIAALLQGETKEEMEAHAERLSKVVKAENSTSFDGGARTSTDTTASMDDLIRGRV